jgi:predicted nuclease with TOPRIM domain
MQVTLTTAGEEADRKMQAALAAVEWEKTEMAAKMQRMESRLKELEGSKGWQEARRKLQTQVSQAGHREQGLREQLEKVQVDQRAAVSERWSLHIFMCVLR